MTLILASSSPRRRELLERLHVPFRVVPSGVDEGPPEAGELPDRYALRLAETKAVDVARRYPADVILAADTVVALNGEFLGKPGDAGDALAMLMVLRGRTHLVATGVVVRCGGSRYSGVEVSRVRMRTFSEEEAQAYVASGEPMDKAGAYAIQGAGGALVDAQIGCYTAVVGLPLCLTRRLLESCGITSSADETICAHSLSAAEVLSEGGFRPVDGWG